MKLILGILCFVAIASLSVAVGSEIQRREDAKEIAKLQKTVAEQQKQIDGLDNIVGSSLATFGDGGVNPFGGGDLSSRVDALCSTVTSASC